MRNTSGPGRKIGITWIILLAIGVILIGSADAAVLNWNTASGNWSEPANWTPSEAPDSADDVAIFTNTSPALVSTNDIVNLSINSLAIRNGTHTLDFAGNSLTCKTLLLQGFGGGINATLTVTNGGAITVTNGVSMGEGTSADAYLTLAPDIALTVGSETARATMNVGYFSTTGMVYMVAGRLVNAWLTNLSVGREVNSYSAGISHGVLDLSAATNAGVIDVSGNLYIGHGRPASGELLLGDLLDLLIGTSNSRGGVLYCGTDINNGPVYGPSRLILGHGRFDAYVTELRVGSGGGNISADGTLDASNVTGGVLDVSGNALIGAWTGPQKGRVMLSDGVAVKIGDAGSRVILSIASADSSMGLLKVGTNRFEAYLNSFDVGLDLGDGSGSSGGTADCANVSSGVLDINGNVRIGIGRRSSGVVRLSDNFTTTIGSSTARVSMVLGDYNRWMTATLSAGGTFNAYLNNLVVCRRTSSTAAQLGTAILDLARVTNGVLDVSGSVVIGSAPSSTGSDGRGTVVLPAIQASAATLGIGMITNNSAYGRLIMTGTVFSVSGDVMIGPTSSTASGLVSTVVSGAPSGLNLGSGSTLTVNQGLISITFKDPANYAPIYWGLRWEGDHVAELTALQAASKLVWNDSAIASSMIKEPVSIFVEDGVTYIGAHVSPGGALFQFF